MTKKELLRAVKDVMDEIKQDGFDKMAVMARIEILTEAVERVSDED